MSDASTCTPDQLSESVAAAYGIEINAVSPLEGGYIHTVWRLDSTRGAFCAKHIDGQAWRPGAIEPGLRLQEAAVRAGHPVPRLWRTRSGDRLARCPSGWIALFDLAPGGHVPDGAWRTEHAHAAGEQLALLHRSLASHSKSGSKPPIPDPDAIRRQATRLLRSAAARPALDPLDVLAEEAGALRLSLLEAHPIEPSDYDGQPYQPVHGDFYPGNLLFTDTQITGILDWDFAGPNWRGIEVARALVECARRSGRLDTNAARAFVAAYAAVTPLTEGRRMFRMWLNYLLSSPYPLDMRHDPKAARRPQRLEAVAIRRHDILRFLADHLAQLEDLVAGLL